MCLGDEKQQLTLQSKIYFCVERTVTADLVFPSSAKTAKGGSENSRLRNKRGMGNLPSRRRNFSFRSARHGGDAPCLSRNRSSRRNCHRRGRRSQSQLLAHFRVKLDQRVFVF